MAVPRREDLPHPREIAAALAARAADVCRYYLRGGVRAGAYWQAGDITGAAGQSLYVHLSGPRAGRWRDAATGDHGDLLDLIRLNGNHASLGPALREARAFLGGRYDIPEPAPSERAASTRRARAADPERIERFLASAGPVRPDNAAGRHLAGRGLSPELAAETLLHHPRARVRVGDALVTSPAILAPIRTPDGRIEAVHRIFITETGGPAEFAGRKRNFGAPAKGGVWFGAEMPTRVVICEGIEDALAIYGQLSGSGRTRVAVVASASADRIAAVDMPATVRDLVLFRDLDEAGARSWQALETRWRDSDVRLVCIAPDGGEGKDANDILLARGAGVLRRRLAAALGPDVEGVREARTGEDRERFGGPGDLAKFVRDALAEELEKLGVSGVDVRIGHDMPDHVSGRYLAGVVEIALADRKAMRGALRHEAIHALRALGGLDGRPWEILESWARREWMDLVDDRYAELPEEQRVEEAVAEAYRLWHDKKLDLPDKPRKVFEAVLNVLNHLRNWCLGHRWSRVEDVFRAIERGEFLAPVPRPDVTGKPPVRVDAIESTWGGLPIRKARKEAVAWAKGNIRGRYWNGDARWHIEVGNSGIGKSTRKESREELEVVRALPALLEHAIRYETELPLKKTRANRGVRAFHHFLGAVVLDGELRRIRLTVREYEDGRRFYDHCSVGESVPWRHVRREQGQTLASTPALPRHTISVKTLFAGVKYRNGDLVLQQAARRRAEGEDPRHMFAPVGDAGEARDPDVAREARERVAEAATAVEWALDGRRDLLAEASADGPPARWVVELDSYGGWRAASEAAAARVRGVLADPACRACLAGMAGAGTDLRDALEAIESRHVADDAAVRALDIGAGAVVPADPPERTPGPGRFDDHGAERAFASGSGDPDPAATGNAEGREAAGTLVAVDENRLRRDAAMRRDAELREERNRMHDGRKDAGGGLRDDRLAERGRESALRGVRTGGGRPGIWRSGLDAGGGHRRPARGGTDMSERDFGEDVLMKRMGRPYYLRDEAPDRLSPSAAEERVGDVVASEAKRRVEEAAVRWNAPTREAVRAASALRLRSETKRGGSVTVSVVDGMPAPLAEATNDLEKWEWWLVVNGPALQRAREGLEIVAGERGVLEGQLGDVGDDLAAVDRSRRFIERTLGHSVQNAVAERIACIEDDVLGAYWVQESKVQIYWMPVAIYSAICDIPIERMTQITLCHELAHAYTHLGLDLNRNAWDTEHFMDTDDRVKEGLAQFYTEEVMRGFEARTPGILGQFLALTERQSEVYTDYQKWVSSAAAGDTALEAVRYAMLEFRNAAAPATYDAFVKSVRQSHGALGGPVPVEVSEEESAQRRLL